jgi:hypothetical protein
LDAGKTAAEIAVELDRTRHAIYGRVQRFYRKRAAEKLEGAHWGHNGTARKDLIVLRIPM